MLTYDNYEKTNLIDIKTFNVAIYVRLSKEDEKEGYSESVINQRDYITRYVLDKGWNIYNTYIDDRLYWNKF